MKKGLVTLVVAASAVGTLGGAARPGGAASPASAVARCDGGRPARSDVHGLAVGAGIAGADGGAILRTSPAGTELIAPPDRGRGVVRHVASRAGVGTAYVRRMKQHLNDGPMRIAQIVGEYTRELLSEVR